MKKGEISVIMAVYNCADTVNQSIDSIIAQTYPNWKMIICDDCSTDNTMQVIQEYKNRYPNKFVIIKNRKNSKLAYSLNHCLRYADGEYCARMDGDDYCAPKRFEEQISYLNQHKDIHLIGTSMKVFNDDEFGREIIYKEMPQKEDLRFGPCFAHASILTYTGVYKELGGYTVSERTVRSQDYDLWFRFFAAGFKGANLAEPLYYVREDKNAFLRRKPSLYLWAVVTRWKGFRLLKYPVKYYWRVLIPLVSLVGNEFRIMKSRLKR